jgi:adenylosuccinate synthase
VKVLAVLGGQWGDEGKGKVVDLLADRFDAVARYHGGHNAGHTVKFGSQRFALHLLPAGIVRGKTGIIGPGVVVDLQALIAEIEAVRAADVPVGDNLLISDRAAVILPYHRLLDAARERTAGDAKLGTTLRGIGPRTNRSPPDAAYGSPSSTGRKSWRPGSRRSTPKPARS